MEVWCRIWRTGCGGNCGHDCHICIDPVVGAGCIDPVVGETAVRSLMNGTVRYVELGVGGVVVTSVVNGSVGGDGASDI